MAVHSSPSKHAKIITQPSLTEEEHGPSCDINLMLKNAARGMQIRGAGYHPISGVDDLTMDAITYHQMKSENLENLRSLAQGNEFSEEVLKTLPQKIREKFGFKVETKKPNDVKNETKNEQHDVKQNAPQTSQNS